MSDVKHALAAIRDVAKAFAPLATIGADIDKLEALVAHDEELQKGIDEKLARSAQIDADNVERLAQCGREIADRQRKQRDAEAGYQARLDALDAEYKNKRTALRAETENAKAASRAECDKLIAEVESLRTAAATERQRITTEHNAFIEETKAHRAVIEANTAVLQAKLDELRAQVAPLMG